MAFPNSFLERIEKRLYIHCPFCGCKLKVVYRLLDTSNSYICQKCNSQFKLEVVN